MEVMMKLQLIGMAVGFSIFALSSCSGGGGSTTSLSQTAAPPLPIVRSYSFAPGKASASAGTVWDIVGVRTTLTGRFANGGGDLYDTLTVDVTFAQSIINALPPPGSMLNQANQLGVVIGFDSDNNLSTGNYLTCDTTNRNLLPFEYFTDGGNGPTRLRDGNYSIIGPGGTPISTGPNADPASEAIVSVNGNVFTESVFLASIAANSGSTLPKFGIDVSAINGANGGPNVSDCVPTDSRVVLPVN